MPPQCRVTFFDKAHSIQRSLVIRSALPLVAADTALEWLKKNHVPVEDLSPRVTVEVITTVECSLSIEDVGGHFQIVAPGTKGAAA